MTASGDGRETPVSPATATPGVPGDASPRGASTILETAQPWLPRFSGQPRYWMHMPIMRPYVSFATRRTSSFALLPTQPPGAEHSGYRADASFGGVPRAEPAVFGRDSKGK